jgi:hypothetical protein
MGDLDQQIAKFEERLKKITKQSEIESLADEYDVHHVEVIEGLLVVKQHGKGGIFFHLPVLVTSVPNENQTWSFTGFERCAAIFEVHESWVHGMHKAHTKISTTVEIEFLPRENKDSDEIVTLNDYLWDHQDERIVANEVIDAIQLFRKNHFLRLEIEEAKKQISENEKLIEDAKMREWVIMNKKEILSSSPSEDLVSCSEYKHYHYS